MTPKLFLQEKDALKRTDLTAIFRLVRTAGVNFTLIPTEGSEFYL